MYCRNGQWVSRVVGVRVNGMKSSSSTNCRVSRCRTTANNCGWNILEQTCSRLSDVNDRFRNDQTGRSASACGSKHRSLLSIQQLTQDRIILWKPFILLPNRPSWPQKQISTARRPEEQPSVLEVIYLRYANARKPGKAKKHDIAYRMR